MQRTKPKSEHVSPARNREISEDQFARAFEAVPDLVMILDTEHPFRCQPDPCKRFQRDVPGCRSDTPTKGGGMKM